MIGRWEPTRPTDRTLAEIIAARPDLRDTQPLAVVLVEGVCGQ